jgi:hypothetical protein
MIPQVVLVSNGKSIVDLKTDNAAKTRRLFELDSQLNAEKVRFYVWFVFFCCLYSQILLLID